MTKPETVLTDTEIAHLDCIEAPATQTLRFARAIEKAILAKLSEKAEQATCDDCLQPSHCRVHGCIQPPTDTALLEAARAALAALEKKAGHWGSSAEDLHSSAINKLRSAINAYKEKA